MRECNFLIFLVLNFQPVTGEDQHGILFEVGALKGFNESERDKEKLFVTYKIRYPPSAVGLVWSGSVGGTTRPCKCHNVFPQRFHGAIVFFHLKV